VSGAAVGAFSVSQYRPGIVVAYLVLLAVLVTTTARAVRRGRPGTAPGRLAGAAGLLAAGVLIQAVPAFTYVTGPDAVTLRAVGTVGAVLAALALALPRGADVALVVAAACYAATSAAALRLDPAPRIDVWYTLQGAADGLLSGHDMYSQVWVSPPGTIPFFTYLPGTALLLAPGRWLLGDVRWALVAVTLATALMFRALAASSRPAATAPSGAVASGAVAGALLLLLPGTGTQVEQAWTEPLLLACLTLAVLGLARGSRVLPVLGVALALASKQHVVVLLPVLAAWPGFGMRRAATSAAGAGVLMLPWAIADPGAMWHDTVTLLINFQPLRFADTVSIAVLNEWGVLPPFWATGAVVVVTVAAACVAVRRLPGSPALVLRCCAVVLFVANLVNKQAFYNQYWLVAGLVLLSWAVPAPAAGTQPVPDPVASRAR